LTKKIISIFVSLILIAIIFSSCGKDEVRTVLTTAEETTEQQSLEESTIDIDITKLLNVDDTWQDKYALSYSYYDSSSGESTIAEGKIGDYYQSMDYSSGTIVYLTQENGYMIEYMLNHSTKTGTAAVVTDSDVSSSSSGFVMLSTVDPLFPQYKNVVEVGTDYVCKRPAVRYRQTQSDSSGKADKIAYVWVDSQYGFASKCELYDAESRKLLMRWELKSFTRNVKENSVKIDLSKYKITDETESSTAE
jgi:outer membrane lipoprotein-sorting protein